MTEAARLAEEFESHRTHLRAVAYRMLGSLSEAEDAVQETWLKLSRADVTEVVNLGGWLTTVIGRVCLDMLRSRTSRREEPLEQTDTRVPDPIVTGLDGGDPEKQALLTDSVGLAMMVVLDTLPPPERLAFVLHDLFAVPFDDIGPVVGRTSTATRQLASRARRRVQGAKPTIDVDVTRQRRAVDAFIAAARDGDFDALLAVLDPDVVVRADSGVAATSSLVRGAQTAAKGAVRFARLAAASRPALVNGMAGVVAYSGGEAVAVLAFTVADGRIVEIDILNDPDRLAALDL